MANCLVCNLKNQSVNQLDGLDTYTVSCVRCGMFNVSGSARAVLTSWNGKRWMLSAWILENKVQMLDTTDIDNVKDIKRPDILSRAEKLLRCIHSSNEALSLDSRSIVQNANRGDPFDTTSGYSLYEPVSWSKSVEEVKFLFNEVLAEELGYLKFDGSYYRFTAKGLLWLEGKRNNKSKKVFVAMWFGGIDERDRMTNVFTQGLAKGIQDAEFEPIRIDNTEHNELIIDQIFAEIKNAGCVIADLTNHNNGVYFEAGYALAHGIPVIWTCDETNADGIHFDVKGYNQIRWGYDKLDELSDKIKNRLLATIKVSS